MRVLPIRRPRPHVLVLALLVCCTLSGPPAGAAGHVRHGTAAAPTAAQTLALLKGRLGAAAKAASSHHVLSRSSYLALRAGAVRLRASLIAPSARCRSALAAAERLPADRGHTARLAADERRAHLGIAACVTAPARKKIAPPVTPTTPVVPAPVTPPAVITPSIAGVVVDSAGRPLPGLPLQVTVVTSPWGPFYGKSVFPATTAADGSFAVAQDPAALGALAYTAIAAFPWHGGTWSRGLVLTGGDAQHLAFQVTLTHTIDAYSGAYDNEGSQLKFFDLDGCSVLSGVNAAYPASDPSTSTLTLTFTPDGPLVDGTAGTATTVTIDKLSLCSGSFVELPAGAWYISGVSSGGRRLAFAHTGATPYLTSYPVFEVSPDTGELEPTIDVHFA